MILDRIALTNFGVYGGRQDIILTPPSPEMPVVLIGAMNGGGKTTLLDALQLAFYGMHAPCSGRGRLAYKEYLGEMIHRGADRSEGAALQIQFRRIVEGKTRTIEITRSWREKDKGIEEFVAVTCDGNPDPVLSEHWAEYIESYLPVKLAGLFFFDGEQITTMAEDEHAAGLLETALQSLLGLDLVERLRADLDVLARRKQESAASVEKRQQIGSLEQAAHAADLAVQVASQERSQLKGQLQHLQGRELEDLRKKFRSEGGDLFARREEIAQERDAVKAELDGWESELRELAAGPAPLLLLDRLLGEIEKQVCLEVEAGQRQVLVAAEAERDRKILQSLRRRKLASDILAVVESALVEHRPERGVDNPARLILHPTAEMPDELRRLREVTLPQTREKVEALLARVRTTRERLARLEDQLGAVPAADAIACLHLAIQAVEQRIVETEIKMRLADEKVRQAESDWNQKEKAWRHALATAAEDSENAEDNRRIVVRIPKVQATLEAFRLRVIARRVKTFERLILESFQQLLRKSRLVVGLNINPEDYRITLTGGDGQPLPFGRLSAGERQLLATAILWGLAKASGRPVPTVIDTPLGRLDSSHRSHLVERYFPAASHQVVLLSTDEEIDGRYLDLLRPFVGREYSLIHDEMRRSTQAIEGYFDHHETTR